MAPDIFRRVPPLQWPTWAGGCDELVRVFGPPQFPGRANAIEKSTSPYRLLLRRAEGPSRVRVPPREKNRSDLPQRGRPSGRTPYRMVRPPRGVIALVGHVRGGRQARSGRRRIQEMGAVRPQPELMVHNEPPFGLVFSPGAQV